MSEKPLDDPTVAPRYCGNCGALIPPQKHFCEACLAPASLATPEPLPPQPVPDEPAASTTPLPDPEAVAAAPPPELAAPVPPAAIAPVPPAPRLPEPRGPEVLQPGGPAMSTPAAATPTLPAEQQMQPVAPAVIPVPPGAPPPSPRPTAPAGQPSVAPYSPPPLVSPIESDRPSSWWLVLMIGGIIVASISLFLACILLVFAVDVGDPEMRLVAIFCCLVPGLLMGAAAFLGGRQYFRKRV